MLIILYYVPDTTTKIIDSLCHWENIPAPSTHRMVMQDVGFAIANKYSALVVEYGSKQPNTFLPLFFPEGVSELTTEISILYYEPGARFISLTLDDFCPLPPIHPEWLPRKDASVAHLEELIARRLYLWTLMPTK